MRLPVNLSIFLVVKSCCRVTLAALSTATFPGLGRRIAELHGEQYVANMQSVLKALFRYFKAIGHSLWSLQSPTWLMSHYFC